MFVYIYPPTKVSITPPAGASTEAKQDVQIIAVGLTNTSIGAVNETAPASDTASSGLNGRLQRVAQRLTSLIALIPASLGQKASVASLAVVMSTEQEAQMGAVNETAPVSDTASSGQNGRLQRIAQRITSLIALLPASIGQKANAASLAVSLSTEQEAELGIVTETAPASDTASSGLNGRLQRVAQRLTSLIALLPASLGQKASAASLAVTLSSEQEAELGIITETAPASDTASSGLNGRLQRIAQRITSLIALVPASLGQKVMASSFAVAIASDQAAIPVTTSVTDTTASGNITTQNLVPAGAATAGSAVEISLNGNGTVSAQVTGTYTGALSVQATVDGTNWITLNGLINVNTGAFLATITSALAGIFQIEAAGFNKIRITGLAAMTGTAVISLRATRQTGMMALDAPLPTGANIIGALSANQSSNISQINAVTPLMGNGVTGTGSLRVTIASDTTANSNPYLVTMRKAAVTAKQATVTAGIAAIRCTTDNLVPSATRQILRVFIDPDTVGATAKFYVGSSTVTTSGATKGEQIYPGAAWIREDDSNDWYIISDTAAQPVAIVEAE